MRYGVPGVEVVTIGRNLTCDDDYLLRRLAATDVLVDATQRHDASVPLIRNGRLGLLPPYAVICDLVVDPYLLDADPPTVRGIEGIPQGNLDRYTFDVDDPAWDLLASRRPDRQPSGGGLVLLVAGRAPEAMHGALREAARTTARDARRAGRDRRGPSRRLVPRASVLPREPPRPAPSRARGGARQHIVSSEMRTPARSDRPPSDAGRARARWARFMGGAASHMRHPWSPEAPGPSALSGDGSG